MKKIFLSLLLVLLFVFPAYGVHLEQQNVPSGNWEWENVEYIPVGTNPNTVMNGYASGNVTLIFAPGTHDYVLEIGSAQDNVTIDLSGATLSGVSAVGSAGGDNLIENLTIKNGTIHNRNGYGLVLSYNMFLTLESLRIQHCLKSGITDTVLYWSNYENLKLLNNDEYGMRTNSSHDLTITGCQVWKNNSGGIQIDDGYEVRVVNSSIDDNNGRGIRTVASNEIAITGNLIQETNSTSIEINSSDRCIITGNNIYGKAAGNKSIHITAQSTHNIVDGNTLSPPMDVFMIQNSWYNIISNNNFDGRTAGTLGGIDANNTGATNAYIGNVFRNISGTAMEIDSGFNHIADTVCMQNTGAGSELRLVGSSAVSNFVTNLRLFGGSGQDYGVYVTGANNVIKDTWASGYDTADFLDDSSAGSNNKWINNIHNDGLPTTVSSDVTLDESDSGRVYRATGNVEFTLPTSAYGFEFTVLKEVADFDASGVSIIQTHSSDTPTETFGNSGVTLYNHSSNTPITVKTVRTGTGTSTFPIAGGSGWSELLPGADR